MKKPIIILLVAMIVLVSGFYWIFTYPPIQQPVEWVHFGVILLVVGFALFVGWNRLRSVRRGEPSEDELSIRTLQRTASLSYYVSLYIWVFLLILKDRIAFDTEQLLGTGILGMAATFAIIWMLLHVRGLKNG